MNNKVLIELEFPVLYNHILSVYRDIKISRDKID